MKKIPKLLLRDYCNVKDISPTLWSGLRGSNSLPPPWQGGALPDELNPHFIKSMCRTQRTSLTVRPCIFTHPLWCFRSESNQRHGDFQSPALPTELQKLIERATRMRLELTTSAVTGRRSNQLNYRANVVGTTGLEPVTLCL